MQIGNYGGLILPAFRVSAIVTGFTAFFKGNGLAAFRTGVSPEGGLALARVVPIHQVALFKDPADGL